MDKLILFTFATYGLCHILMYGTIFNVARKWLTTRYKFLNELFTCALCTGFWCGLIIKQNIIFALYSAAICYILHLVIEVLINKAYPDT